MGWGEPVHLEVSCGAQGMPPHPPRHPHSQLVLLVLKKGDFVKKGGLMSVRVISETYCEQSCWTFTRAGKSPHCSRVLLALIQSLSRV